MTSLFPFEEEKVISGIYIDITHILPVMSCNCWTVQYRCHSQEPSCHEYMRE